ncbi:MAG: hypothetical protein GQ574_01130 [Crocinitomix sp.]|nr:hypothetical protein [Crocinitomix sp.]
MATTPGIITWNRLEPRPRTEDFDRTLRAEVRDALWMMTRQWQFGEFQAEDTGSAIFSKVNIKKSKLDKIVMGIAETTDDIDDLTTNIPLEANVEKEIIEFDFLMRLEMSRYWERLVSKRIKKEIPLPAVAQQIIIDIVIDEFRKTDGPDGLNLNFTLPDNADPSNSAFYSNPELWHATAAHTDGRAFDGYEFYLWLSEIGNDPAAFIAAEVSADPVIETSVLTIITSAKSQFIDWFNRNYAQPNSSSNSAWNSSQLEYQFSIGAMHSVGDLPNVLVSDEYYHGSLDWYAFDFDKETDLFLDVADPDLIEEASFTVIPAPVKFTGMPNPRWWEMEDRKVDLGDVNPSTSDTAKIIFSEFGLIYSNDWMIFPHTVEAGTICEIQEIVVTDCFGQRTLVESANGTDGVDDDWNRWSFFGLSSTGDATADTRLFIPPVAEQVFESAPVEEVNFIRDEMANMVWGIEKTIPNGLGGGINGYETALKHVDFLQLLAIPDDTPPTDNEAVIKYKVSNTVPENWIPFIPAKLEETPDSRQIQLQRGALPRYIEGFPAERIRPRTNLLKANFLDGIWSPYFIHEDEVPRAGAIVKRTWQRTRTEDGTVVTWMGRRKTTGRGEGSSNLSFDNIEDK